MPNVGSRILDYMIQRNYRVRDFNIIYIEGVDPDTFALNNDIPDLWNDTRNVIMRGGEIVISAVATTEPGRFYSQQPMNPNGAARIKFGQFQDAWIIGKHHQQEALVQCNPIAVHRDLNKDGYRTGDNIQTGLFGINQHTTSNGPSTIGRWSAGCLVGRYPVTHKKFIELCRRSGAKLFDTTVLDGSELHRLGVLAG